MESFRQKSNPTSWSSIPTTDFLFVAGYESGRLAIYHVLDDGKLRQLDSRPVGRKPKGVLVARQDNSPLTLSLPPNEQTKRVEEWKEMAVTIALTLKDASRVSLNHQT